MNKGKASSTPRNPGFGKKGEHLVATQFLLIIAFIATPTWNPLVTQELLQSLFPLRIAIMASAGIAALILGGFGSHALSDVVTPLPYPVNHSRLVQDGIYAHVRHPLYGSQLVAGTGWVVFTLSLPHLALLVLAFSFFSHKASKEEAWLIERHPGYATYREKTKKFIPWLY